MIKKHIFQSDKSREPSVEEPFVDFAQKGGHL